MRLIYITNARIPTQMGHGYQITKTCESFALYNAKLPAYVRQSADFGEARRNDYACPLAPSRSDGRRANDANILPPSPLSKGGMKGGLDVELIIPTRINPIKEDVFEYYGLKRNFQIRKIESYDWLKRVEYLGRFAFYLQSWWFFTKLLFVKVDKNAIIYTRNPEIACIFKFRGFKKVVYECHEWFGRGAWLYLLFLRKADYIITTNSFIKKEFIDRGFDNKKFLVAPNGVDFDIFDLDITKEEAIEKLIAHQRDLEFDHYAETPPPPPPLSKGGIKGGYQRVSAEPEGFFNQRLSAFKNKKILLYTGSLKLKGEKKGVDEILEALKIIKGRNMPIRHAELVSASFEIPKPACNDVATSGRQVRDDGGAMNHNDSQIVFVAVGGNEKEIEYYQKIGNNLGVGQQIYFFPRQTQKNLALFQKMADILLMPFPKIAHYEYYMCPLKMLEYMASKRPIIASDLPSIREILNESNSLICEPGDSKDLAEKINLLLNDQNLGEKLANQAREDAKKYTWNKRAERILDFIQNPNAKLAK